MGCEGNLNSCPEGKSFVSLVLAKGAFFKQPRLSTLCYSSSSSLADSALRELLEEWPVRSYRQVQFDGQF